MHERRAAFTGADFASMVEANVLSITELDDSGSVPRLRAANTGERTVLLLASRAR